MKKICSRFSVTVFRKINFTETPRQHGPCSMGVKQVYSFFVTRHSISEFKVSRLAVGVDFFFKVFFNVLRFISVKV